MFDQTNGNNQYSPNLYIKTTSASILVFTKILEAIAATLGFAVVLITSNGIAALTENLVTAVNEALDYLLPSVTAHLAGALSRFILLIPAVMLLLIILDGIGVFLMRVSGLGTTLVRFVHTIYWLGNLIRIIAFLGGLLYSLIVFSEEMGHAAAILMLGIVYILLFGITFGLMLFVCNYHHDIMVVLGTVQMERLTGKNHPVGNNHLMGRSGWLATGSGILCAFSAFLFIYPLVTGEEPVLKGTLEALPDLGAMVILGFNFFFWLTVFLKYLSLRICMGNFRKYHNPAPADKKSKKSCLVWVIVIIILAWLLLRNGGAERLLNSAFSKGSSQTTEILPSTRTPTPEPVRGGAKATATTVPTATKESSGVDPDLKAFLDGYESFMDEYVTFMKKYMANPTDMSLLLQYASMMEKMADFEEAADRYDEKKNDMSAADYSYYITVMTRINKKLLTVY